MNEQGVPANVMMTYYAIPLRGQADKPQPVSYHTADWVCVDNNILESSSAKNRTDFVRIVQPTFEQMQEHGIDLNTVDTEITLFAGVAKTLSGSFAVPNLFSVSDGALVVPVAKGTSRGLVLIFTRQHEGVTVDLVASSDPEIKNSVDGVPGASA